MTCLTAACHVLSHVVKLQNIIRPHNTRHYNPPISELTDISGIHTHKSRRLYNRMPSAFMIVGLMLLVSEAEAGGKNYLAVIERQL